MENYIIKLRIIYLILIIQLIYILWRPIISLSLPLDVFGFHPKNSHSLLMQWLSHSFFVSWWQSDGTNRVVASYQNEWGYLNDNKPNQEAVIDSDGSWRWRLFVRPRDDLSHLSVLSFPSVSLGKRSRQTWWFCLRGKIRSKNTSKQATKSCKITYEAKWESARI